VRALYSVGSFIGNAGGSWQFSVPNAAHGARCGEHRAAVEAALAAVVGGPVTLEFVVGGRHADDEHTTSDGGGAPASEAGGRAAAGRPARPPAAPADEDVDLSELTDAPPESVTTPLDRLAEAFPGSEFVGEG
jgi:DNA polymerase-3 subunit gamma/tau